MSRLRWGGGMDGWMCGMRGQGVPKNICGVSDVRKKDVVHIKAFWVGVRRRRMRLQCSGSERDFYGEAYNI